jgi:hypothetical protein
MIREATITDQKSTTFWGNGSLNSPLENFNIIKNSVSIILIDIQQNIPRRLQNGSKISLNYLLKNHNILSQQAKK